LRGASEGDQAAERAVSMPLQHDDLTNLKTSIAGARATEALPHINHLVQYVRVRRTPRIVVALQLMAYAIGQPIPGDLELSRRPGDAFGERPLPILGFDVRTLTTPASCNG